MKIDIPVKNGRSITIEGSVIGIGGLALTIFLGGSATGFVVHQPGYYEKSNRSRVSDPVVSDPVVSDPVVSDPSAPIRITTPLDGSAVRRCITVRGIGSIPADEALVIANQARTDNQRYFQGEVSYNPGERTWSARIILGSPLDKHASYAIYAILMHKNQDGFLSTMETFKSASNTWWASPDWPPGSKVVAQAAVHRFSFDRCH